MTAPHLPYRLFVGIDIAAKTCAVSWMTPSSKPSRAISIEQTPRGFAELLERLRSLERLHRARRLPQPAHPAHSREQLAGEAGVAEVEPGLPPHLLVRAALETCADAGEAARLLAGAPHLAAFNYTLADPEGRLLALECYPGLPVRIRWCARTVAVANHYTHPSLAPLQGRRPLANSRARAELMRQLPPPGADPWWAAQLVLADHSAPVCAHREHGSTLWSGVFDLTGRRAAYAFGAPCVAPFVERPFPGVAGESERPALWRAVG